MPRPDDLDVVALTNANGNQLDYWIDATNKGLAKKVLIKTGTVDVRRQRLADYFGINLSAVPDTPTVGPITRDIAINQMQWAHLRTLGDEWAAKDSAGAVFRLVPDNAATSITHPALLPSIKSAIDETLAGVTNLSLESSSQNNDDHQMDDETVQALIKSVHDGDVASIITLFKLQASLTGDTSPQTIVASNASSSVILPNNPSSNPALPVTPPTSLAPVASLDSIVLANGAISVEALKRAEGLRDVVSQIENGEVAKIRELYGPEKGRPTNPMWATIKGTITRRERIAEELQNEFNGDKEKFFAYFTITDIPVAHGKKTRATLPAEKLRPLRLVSEAIPHRDTDLAAEKELAEYQENGLFSLDLWAKKWDGQNKWEIWRIIGKEKYSREKK
ncbi:hypothetical protein C8J57DRAFT_1583977 [Mycena rebaudengoi]|nr:hypothetical protein C8J57DRAFT_1583977 [Mycena rebaudengoi]